MVYSVGVYLYRYLSLLYSCNPMITPMTTPAQIAVKAPTAIVLKTYHIPTGSARVAKDIKNMNNKTKNGRIKNIFNYLKKITLIRPKNMGATIIKAIVTKNIANCGVK
ncbi:hypothetical protein CDOMF_0766 [Campylobacter sp. RM16187]|nr:hypothetical protein CDOMF_0766 [Campylobacter sp. RM16187]